MNSLPLEITPEKEATFAIIYSMLCSINDTINNTSYANECIASAREQFNEDIIHDALKHLHYIWCVNANKVAEFNGNRDSDEYQHIYNISLIAFRKYFEQVKNARKLYPNLYFEA